MTESGAMDASLLEILDLIRCPEKRVPLRAATGEEIAQLNERIAAGEVANMAGVKVEQALEAALVREGDDLAYPICDRIPILIVEEGIAI
ncbi:MAG: hypothetical protein CMJ85_04640 [Planctomycetes bacterium]|nr:hypothetical protein [Planctomycetota bacterium]